MVNLRKFIYTTLIGALFTLPFNNALCNTTEGFADLVAPLMPAVVNISTTQKTKRMSHNRTFPDGFSLEDFNQLFEKFMGPMDNEPMDHKKLVSLGSGFIIDSSGHIVTNYHVIAEADEISVKLSGGKELIAKVIGTDKKTDTALLKVKHNKSLPFVKFGDSDLSRVGDWILAIGNPFGLGSTVTSGIVSANGREIQSEGIVDNFIQTDAAINRGNSGGPMFNTKGEVIGINTIILSPSGGNIGIGFATPSSIVEPIIEQLKKTGKVKRGMLGVRMQPITDDVAESLGLDSTNGALVVDVTKKSAATKAGLEVGDIIIEFNKQPIKTIKQLVKIVSTSPLDQKLPIVVMRNGKKKTLTATLIEDQEIDLDEPAQDKDFEKEREKKYSQFSAKEVKGAYVAKLTPTLREKFNIDRSINGLVVLSYKRRSVWHIKGFKPGDVLVSVNQVDLTSIEQLESAFKSAKSSKKKVILLLQSRGDTQVFTSLPVE
jgi:serine protease Do